MCWCLRANVKMSIFKGNLIPRDIQAFLIDLCQVCHKRTVLILPEESGK